MREYKTSVFPSVDLAAYEPNGLLAQGGTLDPTILIDAYAHGIFPWPTELEDGKFHLLWWSPDPRTVLKPADFHCSRSLKKSLRSGGFKVSMNQCFDRVIALCASVDRSNSITQDAAEFPEISSTNSNTLPAETDSSWITDSMQEAYSQLHNMGFAHSIEVWQETELVGGLYGVTVGRLFCGESMFHLATDASKVAFYALCEHIRAIGWPLIDCQVENPHLTSLGASEISRAEFKQYLPNLADEWQNDLNLLKPDVEFDAIKCSLSTY